MAIKVEGWELIGEHQSARVSKVYWYMMRTGFAAVRWENPDGSAFVQVMPAEEVNCYSSDGEKGDPNSVLRALAQDVYDYKPEAKAVEQTKQTPAEKESVSVAMWKQHWELHPAGSRDRSDNALSLTQDEIRVVKRMVMEWAEQNRWRLQEDPTDATAEQVSDSQGSTGAQPPDAAPADAQERVE